MLNKFFTLTLIFFLAIPVQAVSPDVVGEFSKRVKKITLKNGMRVIMVERPSSPIISFAMFIRTGGLDDPMGLSGMAHMFEHMLFKGSKTVGTKNYKKEKVILAKIDKAVNDPEKLKALQEEHEKYLEKEEFWRIYERAGARGLNAGTGYDFTNYVVSLPKNRIKLWMELESDRIKNPVLREFYKERDVVKEERRLRYDTSPRGKLREAFLATAFMAHPYGRPIVGWPSDIGRVTRKDADAFFKKNYDISRLVLTVVGGFEAEAFEKMLRQYFDPIKARKLGPLPPIPVEPKQEGERRVNVEFDAEPRLMMGYHRPDMTHADTPVLEVISDLLSTGKTSRFNKVIVQKERVAVSAWSYAAFPGDRDPNLFVVGGSPRAPHTTKDLERSINKEIQRLADSGPTEAELQKVKNFSLDFLIRAMASNGGMAYYLGFFEAVGGDWERLPKLIQDIQAVTAEDVKRVMKKYLIPSNRTVATLVRKK